MEIDKEKTKEKSREIINYIAIDYDITCVLSSKAAINNQISSQPKAQIQLLKNIIYYEISYDKREQLSKAFSDLALTLAPIQITKSSMKSISINKPKVFSSK